MNKELIDSAIAEGFNSMLDEQYAFIDENFGDKFWLFWMSELQQYFRNTYNYHIEITVDFYKDGINYNWQVMIYDKEDDRCTSKASTGMYGDNHEYPSYEIALEHALLKSFARLKDPHEDDLMYQLQNNTNK